MKKREEKVVILVNQKIYSLTYTNDVLIADDECGMRLLISNFEKYVRKKDLCVKVENTKVIRFRNRKRRIEGKWEKG